MTPLPIDELLSDIARTVAATKTLVLEAPPGAGKTTRVPPALAAVLPGRVWVSEPRRIAARLAARRVANERGTELGAEVGYSVRFDEATSRATRVVYMTDGVLLRRLASGGALAGVDAVVLDEFHERRLAADLALALLERLRRTVRPDLALVVMSATLDAAPLARHLGCARLASEGRLFPVAVEHLPRPDERALELQVASAVKTAVREEEGDVLVFLPGAKEIRRALEACAPFAAAEDLLLLPLHGDMPLAEQVRAVERAERRKVILATNVAESSLTVEGVTVVIDAGLARAAAYSPWLGLPTLETVKVSRAAAAQRAGRAGRTRPGRVFRLYTRADHDRRPEHERPEIARLDLSEAALSCAGLGVRVRELPWLTPPPEAAVAAAEALLRGLGALDEHGALTAVGRRMVGFPVHPRLARLLVAGEDRGIAADTCLAAALLSERDIRRGFARGSVTSGPSDVGELMGRFEEARALRFDPERLRARGLDIGAARAVDAVTRQLRGMVRRGAGDPEDSEAALGLCLLEAWSDRLARRRKPGGRELVLASGTTAVQDEASVVDRASLLVALDTEEIAGRATVRLASRVEPEWLLDLFSDRLVATDELVWNGASERVERVSRIAFGSVVLDESRARATPGDEAGRVLFAAVEAAGIERFAADAGLERLLARLEIVRAYGRRAATEEPRSGEASPPIDRAVLLASACREVTSFAELTALDVAARAREALPPATRAALETLAPERVKLPGGRVLEVNYAAGQAPWVASRLQDFFGLREGPRIAAGALPLVVHLTAPSQRPVQVTSDLAGFWARHYPSIRRELMRRYPKHAWPEDGGTATPPPPGRPRR